MPYSGEKANINGHFDLINSNTLRDNLEYIFKNISYDKEGYVKHVKELEEDFNNNIITDFYKPSNYKEAVIIDGGSTKVKARGIEILVFKFSIIDTELDKCKSQKQFEENINETILDFQFPMYGVEVETKESLLKEFFNRKIGDYSINDFLNDIIEDGEILKLKCLKDGITEFTKTDGGLVCNSCGERIDGFYKIISTPEEITSRESGRFHAFLINTLETLLILTKLYGDSRSKDINDVIYVKDGPLYFNERYINGIDLNMKVSEFLETISDKLSMVGISKGGSFVNYFKNMDNSINIDDRSYINLDNDSMDRLNKKGMTNEGFTKIVFAKNSEGYLYVLSIACSYDYKAVYNLERVISFIFENKCQRYPDSIWLIAEVNLRASISRESRKYIRDYINDIITASI